MEYLIKDKETNMHLARQSTKPSKEYMNFWINRGFKPIIVIIDNKLNVVKTLRGYSG